MVAGDVITVQKRLAKMYEKEGRSGPLVFDRAGAILARGDGEIHLTSTEFRLLCVLADHPGQVLSRTALLEHVWEHGYFGDERIVDVHVRRLRKKLEVDVLRTIRGLGYCLSEPDNAA